MMSDKLRNVVGLKKDQSVTQKEAADLVSKYILDRKYKLFDPRNILVAIVEQDPLGHAFNVRAFHRNQVLCFIKKHLTPINNNTPEEDEQQPQKKKKRDGDK